VNALTEQGGRRSDNDLIIPEDRVMKPMHTAEYGVSVAIMSLLFTGWAIAIAWFAGGCI
jgi:hypothetical protein